MCFRSLITNNSKKREERRRQGQESQRGKRGDRDGDGDGNDERKRLGDEMFQDKVDLLSAKKFGLGTGREREECKDFAPKRDKEPPSPWSIMDMEVMEGVWGLE